MKIVYALKALSKGGAERVIANLANYSVMHGHEAYIITLVDAKIEYKLDSKVTVINCGKSIKKSNKILQFFKLVKFIRQELKKVKPDVILSFLPQVNFVTLLANKNEFPIIISARNDHKIEFPNKVYMTLMKWLYPKTDGFIFQTTDQKDYFDSIGIKKEYAVIPNPINDDFIIEPYSGKREKTIVSVGRLTNQKNQKLLIDSFNEIHQKYQDYKLIIYGEGKLRDELNSQINTLNLNDMVILAGNVDNIKGQIYKSSIFILSSDYEGMPNALMEAMALGIPSISTDCPCGGPRTLIRNKENGILVEVNNQEQMAKAIDLVLSDEKLAKKLSINAHNDICNNYNSKLTYEKFFTFFKKIIRESGQK